MAKPPEPNTVNVLTNTVYSNYTIESEKDLKCVPGPSFLRPLLLKGAPPFALSGFRSLSVPIRASVYIEHNGRLYICTQFVCMIYVRHYIHSVCLLRQ
jgi:hypothetical protein